MIVLVWRRRSQGGILMPVAEDPPMPDPLARLTAALADRYTLEHEIGAGGMATVYLACDVKHDRPPRGERLWSWTSSA